MHIHTKHLQGRKNTALRLSSVMLMLVVLLIPATGFATHIAIISSSDSPVYQRIIDAIKKTANREQAEHVSFEVIYTNKPAATTSNTIDNADLLVSIGRRAMLSILQREKSPPILATLIPRQVFKQNLSALKAVNNKVAAIYVDSPPERQILLAKLLLGKVQTMGILWSEKSSASKQTITAISKQAKVNIHIEEVTAADNIIRKLSHALSISDTLLALPDPLIFNRNTARNILLTTYRKRIPVIGFSANYVKAGALAASFSTPEQIATQTGLTILKILRTPSVFPQGGEYPADFDVALNPDVARSLGINMPPKQQLKKELQKLLTEYK